GKEAYGRGRVGAAFLLDDDSLEVKTPYYTLDGAKFRDGSIEGWFQVESGFNGTLLQFFSNDRLVWHLATDARSRLVFRGPSGEVLGTSTLMARKWHHMAMIRSEEQMTVCLLGRRDVRRSLSAHGVPSSARGQPTWRGVAMRDR